MPKKRLLCLTGNARESVINSDVDGSYSYHVAGLKTPLLPEAEPDHNAAKGEIPFSAGRLTNGKMDGVRWSWSWHTGLNREKDIVFDLKRDCAIERVDLFAEGMLEDFEVWAKGKGDSRFRFVSRKNGESTGNFDYAWPSARNLNTWGRFVMIRAAMGWGKLIEVRIWGRELNTKQQLTNENPYPLSAREENTYSGPEKGEFDFSVKDRSKVRIVPYPQEIRVGAGAFSLKTAKAIVISNKASEQEQYSAQLLKEKFESKGNIRIPIVHGSEPMKNCVLIGSSAAAIIRRAGLRVQKREGYGLLIDSECVAICGHDEAGTFYGVQSLIQLLDQAGELNWEKLPGLKIRDWPFHALRGVHVYCPGPDAIEFFKKYVREFVSRFKINTMIFETAAGILFDTHPEINRAWAKKCKQMNDSTKYPGHVHHHEVAGGKWITKTQAASLIDWCRKHHINVIPEIQSLSHCEYLLAGHPEICELPPGTTLSPEKVLSVVNTTGSIYRDVPVAFCPSNRKSYKILFDISEELYQLFKPTTVGIGHDEWREQQLCPKCGKKRGWELFGEDVLRTYDFWHKKGVDVMIWSDHFLEGHNGGPHHDWTAKCLPKIPRDIIMGNWSASVDPRSVEYLRKQGFRQLLFEYGTHFAHPPALKETYGKVKCYGLVATTWIRTDAFHYGIKGCFGGQFFTADNAWSPNHPAVRSKNYHGELASAFDRARKEFQNTPSYPDVKSCIPIDLRRFANIPLQGPGFVDSQEDLRNLPRGRHVMGGVPFTILGKPKGGSNAVLCLENPWRRDPKVDLPNGITGIPIRRKAGSLFFLHSTSVPDVSTYGSWIAESCRYRIHYEDGRNIVFSVKFNEHIMYWKHYHGIDRSTNLFPAGARVAWRGPTSRKNQATLFLCEWVNPHPDNPIRAMDFLSPQRPTLSRPMLFAVTASK